MSENVTPEELEKLLRQLSEHDLEAIGRKLGLNLHEADRNEVLRTRLIQDKELRKKAEDLALTLPNAAQCSFCGKQATADRRVITSPTGAAICGACLQGFKGGKK